MKYTLVMIACLLAPAAAVKQGPGCSEGSCADAHDKVSLMQSQLYLQHALHQVSGRRDEDAPADINFPVVEPDSETADQLEEDEQELALYANIVRYGKVTITVGGADFIVAANDSTTIDMLEAAKQGIQLLQTETATCPSIWGPNRLCGPQQKRAYVDCWTTLAGCYLMTQVFQSPRQVSSYYYWRANPSVGYSANGDAFGWCRGCDSGFSVYTSSNPWHIYSCSHR